MSTHHFKRILFLLLASLPLIGSSAPQQRDSSLRERLSFNDDWRFTKEDPRDAADTLAWEKIKDQVGNTGNQLLKNKRPQAPATGPGENISYTRPDFDDSGWRRLDLPHDWGIEGPFRQEYPGNTGKLPFWGVGWYRKHFRLNERDSGKRIFLDVDGAMSYSTAWINGHFAGGWPYGYSSFRLELTPHLRFGQDNVIAVRLDNPPDSSRWYPGGGIYRNVWLVKTTPLHVSQWGIFVTTPQVTAKSAKVSVTVRIDNQSDAEVNVTAVNSIFVVERGRRAEKPIATSEKVAIKIASGGAGEGTANMSISTPRLWSIREPNLYAVVTTIEKGGKTVDSQETIFGIRTIKFDATKGFLLNGERIPINGVCDHHDLGALGAAINVRALERQIELLKEMGVNAIRTSHNPPASELLDLCDRMGIIVMDEAFDCWRIGKTRNDYHLVFEDWHEKDLRALLRRDRNHPCVVLWSIGNEVPEQRTAEGARLAAELAAIVREEDSTRPVTSACNIVEGAYNGFQKTLDVYGFNYKPTEYAKFRARNPNQPVQGNETSSCVSTRGEYFFPVSDDKSQGRADFQVSSYDLYAPPWAWPPDVEWKGLDENRFAAGEFVWTGFDYLGEPTPYGNDVTTLLNFSDEAERQRMKQQLKELGKIQVPSRSSYFGILDLAGFKKDRYYLYQSRWRPELPMVHILPHWNWPSRIGEVTPVHVYSSGDEVELFLNGKSLGKKKREPLQYRFRWDDLKYEPGELHAVAYRNGKKWAESTVKTTGPAAAVQMKADRSAIRADGADLSFVTVSIVDKGGLVVPRSRNMLRLSITSPGEIVAVDSGDPTSHVSFRSLEQRAFNGLCLVIVRSQKGQAGPVTVSASSEGLTPAKVAITAK